MRFAAFLILTFSVFSAPNYAADFTLALEHANNRINDRSIINRGNLFGVQENLWLASLKILHIQPLASWADFSLNATYLRYDKSPNSKLEENRLYIDSLVFHMSAGDEWIFEAGKNQVNFGNSMFENILNMTPTGFDRRLDEGLWAITARRRDGLSSSSISFLPAGGFGEDVEFKNRNSQPQLRIQYDNFFDDMDVRTILNADLDIRMSPFVAVSLSSPLPGYSNVIGYIDVKVINHDQKLKILALDSTSPARFETEDSMAALLSPFLAGITTTLLEQMEFRLEYIYNRYGLDNQESQTLFDALQFSPALAAKFAAFYRNNFLGRHYANVAFSFPFLMNSKLSYFASAKANLTDGSAIFRTGFSYILAENWKSDVNFTIPLTSNTRSEFGSYLYRSEIRTAVSYAFSI